MATTGEGQTQQFSNGHLRGAVCFVREVSSEVTERECNEKVKSVLVSLGQYYNRTVPSAIGYGMTETSPSITHMVKGARKYESVGGPIPNTEMKVVDLETGSSLAARQTG